MTTREVYEKYKHLDSFLSDPLWFDERFFPADECKISKIFFEFWQAIKEEIEKEIDTPSK